MMLDAQLVKDRTIEGAFKKFTYYCNGFETWVYCHNVTDFQILVRNWNKQGYNGLYKYTYDDVLGVEIALDQIVCDQNFKTKAYVTSNEGVRYIK